MKKILLILFAVAIIAILLAYINRLSAPTPGVKSSNIKSSYWLMLHRKSNIEFLFYGTPGDKKQSVIKKIFKVKTGIPGERPTPLPELLGREYWLITKKESSAENPETAPYFLTLDIPAPESEPFGPAPYKECAGEQCNWILPGAFGLHGINGDNSRLTAENPGSSGCIRHTDEDITYLYNLINPEKEKIRYYIKNV